MTDRTDHRAKAEWLLADAEWWAAQAGELSPEASERACLARAQVHALRAQVHALLALHDALSDRAAADRYAANEERQREAEPDPLALDEAECSRCGTTYPSTAEATMEHHRACTGETPENPLGDPLDEDDHRDRLDGNGLRVRRKSSGYWAWVGGGEVGGWTLDDIHRLQGPLTFAPDAAPDATGTPSVTASVADDPGDDAVDGKECERRYLNAQTVLCPECGHDIDQRLKAAVEQTGDGRG